MIEFSNNKKMFQLKPTFQIKKPSPTIPKGSMQSMDFKSQLQSLGKDTSEIDSGVSQEIESSKNSEFSQQKLARDTKMTMKKNNIDFDTAYDATLKYYESKGFSVKGIEPTQQTETPEQPLVADEIPEEKSAVVEGVKKSLSGGIGILKSINQTKENIVGGATANIPEMTGNVLGFLADVVTPEKFEGLGDKMREIGINTKEDFQEATGVDPDAFTTKAGEFGVEVGSLFIPGGQAKLISKIPGAKNSIISLSKTIDAIAERSPKAFSIIKSAITGGKESFKFGVVSEGESSLTDVAIGAILNPVLGGAANKLSGGQADDLLRKITGLNKNQLKKNGIASTKEDVVIGVNAIKKSGDKPETREQLFNTFKKIKDDIYTKYINPILEKAGEKGKVQISGLTDDIVNKIDPEFFGKRFSEGAGTKTDDFSEVIGFWKNFESNVTNFKTLEEAKVMLGATLRGGGATGNTKAFLTELNKRLGTKIDEALELVGGPGVKELKREYAAISNLQEPLYTKVVQEMKGSSSGLVDLYGMFSAIGKGIKGNFTGAGQDVLTVKILNKLRDPNAQLRKLIKDIYGINNSTMDDVVLKLSGVSGANIGEELDKSVNQ